MTKLIFKITILLLFLSLQKSYSQDKLDSLDQALEQVIATQGDKSKPTADLLTEMYLESKELNPFSSIQYAARALEIYNHLNDSANIALLHRYIGDNYFQRKIYNMAMDSYTKSYDLYMLTGNELQEAYSMIKIGDTYLAQNLVNNASEQYLQSLKIFKTNQDKEGMSHAYERIAAIKLQEYSQETGLKYLDSALLLRRSLRDDKLIALSYEQIANAHLFCENYEEAEDYLGKALTKYKVSNKKIKVADIYSALGVRFMSEEKYNKAKTNVTKALKIYEKYDIPDKIAEAYNSLGLINYEKAKYLKARTYAEASLEISLNNNFRNIEKESYKLLSDIYLKLKEHKKSLQYLQKYSNLVNILAEEERSKQSTELQVNMATQKKEQEIKLLKKDRELQDARIKKNEAEQRTLYFGVALLGLILLFTAIFGYYLYRTNKKTRAANNLLIEKNNYIQKQKDEIENKNDKIFASLNYASRIQKAMLPKMSEIKADLQHSFVFLKPRDVVSGDFFWYGKTKDAQGNEKNIIAAVDCTGHGVPGAFMAMIGDAYLNQIIYLQKVIEPEKILSELHKGINTALKQGTSHNNDGMDIALCVIDKKENTLKFAGAKNPLVYFQKGEVNLIKGNTNSIGGFTQGHTKTFTGHTVKVTEPTTFYIYSDGFQDQFGGVKNKKYMAKRFRMLLHKIHEIPLDQQADTISNEFKKWRKNYPQMDDVLIIGFKMEPA